MTLTKAEHASLIDYLKVCESALTTHAQDAFMRKADNAVQVFHLHTAKCAKLRRKLESAT